MKKLITVILTVAVISALCISAFAEENVLKVGMEGTYAPYTYHDDSGALTGFEVDVANAIGEKIGYSVEFVEGAWDSLFPALAFAASLPVAPLLNKLRLSDRTREVLRVGWLSGCLALSVLFLVGQSYNPFIYFQF